MTNSIAPALASRRRTRDVRAHGRTKPARRFASALLTGPLLLIAAAPVAAQVTPDDSVASTPAPPTTPAAQPSLDAQLRAQAQARAMERARAQATADAFGSIGVPPTQAGDPGRDRPAGAASADASARAAPSPYGSYYQIRTPWDPQ